VVRQLRCRSVVRGFFYSMRNMSNDTTRAFILWNWNTGYAILTADQRANYGVRIYWGIVPQGEVTVEMASGAKHYLAKPPEIGEVLGNSVFMRKQKHVFDFEGDSGNCVFFCCRFYQNLSGCYFLSSRVYLTISYRRDSRLRVYKKLVEIAPVAERGSDTMLVGRCR
jgi:hypothetical protein